MKRSHHISGVIALLLLASTAGCGSGEDQSGFVGRVIPPQEPVLRIASGGDPTGLDPTRYSDQPSWRVARLLFEGLLSFTSDGRTTAGVAQRWDVNSTATLFTFELRSDARWSDGTPVTAGDFIFAWRRVLDPRFGAETAEGLYPIKGARQINRGEAQPGTLGARALSDNLLEVELEHPDPRFPSRTALPPYFPLPAPSVGSDYLNWPAGTDPVCNGPFVLESWQPDDRLTVRRSDTYWNRERVELQGAVLFPLTDPTTTINLYRAGEIDWTTANTIPMDQARQLLKQGASEVYVSPVYATYYLEVNTRRAPTSDLRVRRALEMTVPREAIAGQIYGTGHIPSRVLVSTDLPDWTPPQREPVDIEKARRLLAEAGYPGGEGMPTLVYLYNAGGPHGMIAEFLQGAWQQQLGIDLELVPMEFASMEERGRQGDFHLLRSSWLADLPAPEEFLTVFQRDNPNNLTGWHDGRFDLLLDRARSTLDRTERFRLLRDAEKMLLDDTPIIPLLHYATVQLVKPYVIGLKPNPLDVIGWAGLKIDLEWLPPR